MRILQWRFHIIDSYRRSIKYSQLTLIKCDNSELSLFQNIQELYSKYSKYLTDTHFDAKFM